MPRVPPQQPRLFDDEPPSAPAQVPATVPPGLQALKFEGPQPTAEQQRFNHLLERSESLAARLGALQALADTMHQQQAKSLGPLQQQRDTLLRSLVTWLDRRLADKGLTRNQQMQAREILCSIAADFAHGGDEAMRALHDAHSSDTLADQRRADAAAAQDFIEEVLGEKLVHPDGSTDNFDDPEAVLRATMAKMEAEDQAREAARAAHQARRKKSGKAKGAKADSSAAAPADADGALRGIYRQLASALHPDREPDAQERLRKTELMSQANAAYARRDLPALLQLQLQAAVADRHKLGELARDKLAALSTLLKERVDTLQSELRSMEQLLRREFGLAPQQPVTEAQLRRHVADIKRSLQAGNEALQHELRAIDDDGYFKRWLREQHRFAQQQDW